MLVEDHSFNDLVDTYLRDWISVRGEVESGMGTSGGIEEGQRTKTRDGTMNCKGKRRESQYERNAILTIVRE